LDFTLWQEAVVDICSSRLRVHSVGKYVAETHRIHPWQWCPDSNTLLYLANSSATMDVYFKTTKKLNSYTKTETCPWSKRGEVCSVEEIQPRVFRMTSTARRASTAPFPNSFLNVLRKRGWALGAHDGRRRDGVGLRGNPGWIPCRSHGWLIH
jgi:hypothetical protein